MSMHRIRLDPPRNGLSRADRMYLRGVVFRIARRYPPDWLERRGSQLYCVTTIASLALTYLIGTFWSPWWTYLIPVVFPLFLSILLVWLFDREPGRPRWAHPLAIVNNDDTALIGQMIEATDGQLKTKLSKYCPVNNGARLFAIWQVLQYAEFDETR